MVWKWASFLCWILFALTSVTRCGAYGNTHTNFATFVILGQRSNFDTAKAVFLKDTILKDFEKQHEDAEVIVPHLDFSNFVGSWAMWTLFSRLHKNILSKWYIFLEADSHVNANVLIDFMQHFDSHGKYFLGCGLYDESPVIIHHFHGYDATDGQTFLYPDTACGILLSRGLLAELVSADSIDPPLSLFSIDAKHEIALLILKRGGTTLSSYSDTFCNTKRDGCAIYYDFAPCESSAPLTTDKVLFSVKTYHGNHDSRVPIIKNTWGASLPSIEFFSDVANESIPTIAVGVPNTKRGHCEKTLVILRRFADISAQSEVVRKPLWLFIADDDTLLSVSRLLRLLSCYNSNEKVIVGERYGYGFSGSGLDGYDYPTGGSGMAFSHAAVKAIVSVCDCPTNDSPDDMIIGVCARKSSVAILHSAAFHQARHVDYPKAYLERIPPISFHKFDDVDPYQVYAEYLVENHTETLRKQEL
ncbi:unnamed protein product [Cylicocyclus nassatus]|uniref:N-acetylgalactosaminide beta-1,3-galactosyltransferase n=1 Tax=Cylicocyclus nassatus TaxID=53992 RepID=A0AA36GFC2_CYLNA|nr:unnamed protein product [Cylicocyclus nassatus]